MSPDDVDYEELERACILDPEDGDEDEEAARPSRSKLTRLSRSNRLFDPVLLNQITDRAWDEIFPPLRLYHYLQIRSRRGAKSVRLTNEMAAEVGVNRQNKWKLLRRLEARGRISVTRGDGTVPEVMVLRPERPARSEPS